METRLGAALAENERVARSKKSLAVSQKLEAGGRKPAEQGPDESIAEDAEVAMKPAAAAASAAAETPPADDEGYVWPEGSEESTTAEMPASNAPSQEAKETLPPLPALDALVKLIPAEARDTLEDLFRVKFVSVKRVSPASLKS